MNAELRGAPFTAICFESWSEVPADWWSARRTPFQTHAFLAAWYETLGVRTDCTPLIVEVRRGGHPAMLLPMVREMRGGLRVVAFADFYVSDNNAPILGMAAPATPEEFKSAWLEISNVIPRADLLDIEKQPAEIAGTPNPMLWLGRPQASTLQSHPLTLGGSFEDYSRSRTKKFRKEQERVWRVFTRAPDAGFELVRSPDRARSILADMERMQSARMAEVGIDYRLDNPIYGAFYRALVARGIESGEVVLGALIAGEETVGALLGVSNGEQVTFVRLAHAGGIWSNCAPGKLTIERTVMALHETGVTRFDFSIGDQSYKEPFGVGSAPLSDVQVPMSWRAWPNIAANRARTQLRQIPVVKALYERVRGTRQVQSLARST